MTFNSIDVGPLEPLLADADITAIFLDSDAVRYEKYGVMHISDIRFESDNQRRQVIEGIVVAGGEMLSVDNPKVFCILSDGTRVQAYYEPLSLSLHKAPQISDIDTVGETA